MGYGILFLRLVLGSMVAAHGAQKLFGSLGGDGLRGTAGFFGSLRFRAPLLAALAAGVCEFGGGLFLASGLLTPVAALAIATVMVTAIAVVHYPNGFWNTKGGYEFNFLIWAAALTLATTGAHRFSLDALLGWEHALRGPTWGVAVFSLSVVVAAAAVAFGRRKGGDVTHVAPGRDASRRAA